MNKKDREFFTRLILDERQRKLSTLGRLQGTLDEINDSRSAEYEEEVTLSDDKEYLSKLIEQDARGLRSWTAPMASVKNAARRSVGIVWKLCPWCASACRANRLRNRMDWVGRSSVRNGF